MSNNSSGRLPGRGKRRKKRGIVPILTPAYPEIEQSLKPRRLGIAIPLVGRAISKEITRQALEGDWVTNHVAKDDQTPLKVFVIRQDELICNGDRSRMVFNLPLLASQQELLYFYASVLVREDLPSFFINGATSAAMSDGFRHGYFLPLAGSVVSESRSNPRHTAIDVGGRTLSLMRVFINEIAGTGGQKRVMVEFITPSSSQELPKLSRSTPESTTQSETV